MNQYMYLAGKAKGPEVDDPVDVLLEAARAHGEQSEADHEVGDLQDLVRACWARLSPADRLVVYRDQMVAIGDWLGETREPMDTPSEARLIERGEKALEDQEADDQVRS